MTNVKYLLEVSNNIFKILFFFRKTFKGSCDCNFSKFCDRNKFTKNPAAALDMSKCISETASILEKQLVHSVYEEIAGHFSDTRHKPWPRVAKFVQSLPANELLLDLGCGNGKYLGDDKLQHVQQIGLDYSRNLLSFVTNKGCDAIRSDVLSLPLRDGVATACINIAVIHHLSTKVC